MKIDIITKRQMQIEVAKAVEKRFYSFERLLNSLRGRLADVEKIIEFREKKWKEKRRKRK